MKTARQSTTCQANPRLSRIEAARQTAAGLADRLPDKMDEARQTASGWAERLPDKVEAARRSAMGLAERLPDRMDAARQTASDWAERLPAPIKDRAQERLGRKRRRPGWLTIGIIVGAVAAAAWLAPRVKRVFAPGVKDDFDGDDEPLGEPHAYAATGSGTGWPQPPRTPEHTESFSRENGHSAAPVGQALAATPPVPPVSPVTSIPSAPAPPPFRAAAPTETGRLAEAPPAPPAPPPAPANLDATLALPANRGVDERMSSSALPASRSEPAERDRSGNVAPAPPAARPPLPPTEEQAETNARLQLRQEALYAAFPGMTRHDIVACDGDLDRLGVILASRLGLPIDEVRPRLDALLGTGEAQQGEGMGIEPDLSVRRD